MINRILRFSLENRLFVLVGATLLLIYGLWTIVHLPVDVFPDLNRPTVTVMTATDAIHQAIAGVDALVAAGKLSAAEANSLKAKLTGAQKNIASGDVAGALDKLRSANNALDAMMRSGRLTSQDGRPIRVLIERTIQTLSR